MINPHNHLLHRLRKTRRVLLWTDVASAFCWAVAISSGVVFISVALESILHLSVSARTIIAGVDLALVVATLLLFVLPPKLRVLGLRKQPSEEDVASLVGTRYPHIHDELANVLQLKRLHADTSVIGYSGGLIDAAFDRVDTATRDVDFNAAVDRSKFRGAFRWMAIGVVASLSCIVFIAALRDASFRLVHYSQSFVPPPPFVFEITPGNARLIRGDSITVTIKTVGREPQHEITLQTQESDQENPRPNVLRSSTGTFTFTFPTIKRSTTYFAEAKGEVSDKYDIVVTDRPEIKSLSLRLAYPSYTHTPQIDLEQNAGDVVGIAGTEIHFSIASNKTLYAASIDFNSDTTADSATSSHVVQHATTTLHVHNTDAIGSMMVRQSGSYTIRLVDSLGNGNTEPIVYHVTALRDEYPVIRVLQPLAVTDITEATKVGIVTRIHDDFGFSKLLLHYRLSASKFAKPWDAFKETSIPITTNGQIDAEVPYIWDLHNFGLVPEDAMEFYLEVFDNDIIGGPKAARSEMLTLRLPSLEAALRESDQSQSDANQNLQEAEKAAEELQKQMEQTTKELRQQSQEKNLSWQEQKKMQDMVKKQEKLQSKVEEAQQQLEDAVRKLETKQALSPETLQKYMELQKLFQELKNPEMLAAMKRLQDAMQKLSPDQMRDAMKNFQLNEEAFKASIERTMEMLKRIQAEQKVDELMKRAEELNKQQQQLNDQMQQAKSKEEKEKLAAEQKDLKERTDAMKKAFEELQKKMNELGKDMPKDEMKQAGDEMEQDKPEQEMQDAAKDMQSDPQSAQQHQKKAQKGLQDFQKNMAAVKKKMQEKQQKQQMTEMRRSLQDLLELSKREEALKKETDQSEPNSSALPEQAKQQANNQSDLASVANRMMKLSQKSFAVTPEMGKQLGKALREMQNAAGNLEQRQPQSAGQNEGNAIGAMNSAAMQMQEALEKMGQGQQQGQQGSGGMQSFMQQLNQMAGEQESLNGQTQKMGNQGQMSMQQQAEMQRLSGQQQAVKNSLDKLKEQQEQLTGGKKNTLGDLNKIAEEMQEVINDMRSNHISPETIQRQERILSRLLDAQRSTHERDFDKKREGKAGESASKESPPELPNAPKVHTLEELLRLQEAGYSKDYERLIRKYFESLKGTVPQ